MDLWFQNPTLNSTVHGQETQKNHPLIRTLYRSFLQFNRPQHKYWIKKKKPTTPKAIKPRWNWKKILTPFRFLQQFRFQTQISLQEIRSNPDATPNKGNWNWNWNWNGFLKIGRNFFFFFFLWIWKDWILELPVMVNSTSFCTINDFPRFIWAIGFWIWMNDDDVADDGLRVFF